MRRHCQPLAKAKGKRGAPGSSRREMAWDREPPVEAGREGGLAEGGRIRGREGKSKAMSMMQPMTWRGKAPETTLPAGGSGTGGSARSPDRRRASPRKCFRRRSHASGLSETRKAWRAAQHRDGHMGPVRHESGEFPRTRPGVGSASSGKAALSTPNAGDSRIRLTVSPGTVPSPARRKAGERGGRGVLACRLSTPGFPRKHSPFRRSSGAKISLRTGGARPIRGSRQNPFRIAAVQDGPSGMFFGWTGRPGGDGDERGCRMPVGRSGRPLPHFLTCRGAPPEKLPDLHEGISCRERE